MSEELKNKEESDSEYFCPIHNKIEDNKNHSKKIRVCEECQKMLLKKLE